MFKNGFTLLEVLICISVILLLCFISLGSYNYFIRKNEQEQIINDLQAAISFAKAKALFLGSPVEMSPLNDRDNWQQGLKLTYYNTENNKRELLHQWQWLHPQWRVIWKGASNKNKITFPPYPSTALSNGQFILSNASQNHFTKLILNRIGRVKILNE